MFNWQKELEKEKKSSIPKLFKGHCCYCEIELFSGQNFTLEHLVCVSHGGNNEQKNKRPCCKFCNTQRGDKKIEDFLVLLEKIKNKDNKARIDTKIKNVKKIIKFIESNAVFLYKKDKLPARYKKK